MTAITQNVRFNGVLLSSIEGFSIIEADSFRAPSRKIVAAQIANTSSTAISSALYEAKKIRVSGIIARTGKSGLEQALRDLQALLQGRNKLLTLEIIGVDTEYTATMSNLSINNNAGGYALVDIDFICTEPYGYKTSSITVANYVAATSQPLTTAYTWQGNVGQAPIITVDINSRTLNGTTGTITITNTTQNISIAVESAYAVNDILIINCKTKTATINGTNVDFTGSIPEWTGLEPIKYSDNFTARNIDYSVTYQSRNL